MKTIIEKMLRAMDAGEDTALAAVVETSGSTPREAGAHMLAGANGLLCGTVGGGPSEARALELCRRALEERRGCAERVVLREDTPLGVGSVCGGDVTLYVHYIPGGDGQARAAAGLALESLAARRRCWLVEGPPGSGGLSVCADTLPPCAGRLQGHTGRVSAGAPVPDALLSALPDAPALVRVEGEGWFVQPLLREERVYIFGGGHVSQALVPALAAVGFRCAVVEDRPEFCDETMFPGVEETLLLPLDNWISQIAVTPRDYLCIMTRGHEMDLDCLDQALRTNARYIGLMGSRRKITITNEKLRQRGFSDADIARIVTPIGLAIGAETPAEIAVSIAAQMIQARSNKA